MLAPDGSWSGSERHLPVQAGDEHADRQHPFPVELAEQGGGVFSHDETGSRILGPGQLEVAGLGARASRPLPEMRAGRPRSPYSAESREGSGDGSG